MKYYEDIEIGALLMTGRYTFSTDKIKSFARRFDPQLFHVDEEEAARSHFGALCASGWHTASAWMRLYVDYRRTEADAARARGEPVASHGPALGFRELKWLKPVYAGDVIDYKGEVADLRPSGSRPGFGLISIRATGTNQNGVTVITFVSTAFVERRPEKP